MERLAALVVSLAWTLFLAAIVDVSPLLGYSIPAIARFYMFVASPVVGVIGMLMFKGKFC